MVDVLLRLKIKMNWQEDVYQDLLVGKKSAPKQGRRAGAPKSPETTEQLLDSALESIAYTSPREFISQPRKTGGWADEGIKSARSKGTPNLIEEERFQDHNIDSDNDDIPIIPDIDDIQEDLLSPQEMKMPTILINKSTYKELDKELTNIQLTSNSLQSLAKSDDINLSILFKNMLTEADIEETDEEWTMDSLFSDIISANTAI